AVEISADTEIDGLLVSARRGLRDLVDRRRSAAAVDRGDLVDDGALEVEIELVELDRRLHVEIVVVPDEVAVEAVAVDFELAGILIEVGRVVVVAERKPADERVAEAVIEAGRDRRA